MPTVKDLHSDFFNRSQYDVRHWNEVIFADFEKPWSSQWDIWESVANHRRTTVRSGHGIGKSHIAARIAIWFLTTFYPSVVFTTAPTARQVDHVLWGEIRRQWKKSLVDLGGRVYDGRPKIFIDDDWYALGFTTRKRVQGEDIGSLFQGFHSLYVLFIIDEAAGVDKEVHDSAESVCTTEHSRILEIGNPTDGNSEFARHHKAPPPDKPGGWSKVKISVLDSPNVKAGKNIIPKLTSYDWPEDRRVAWGEESPMYQAKVLAQFPEMGINALIPLPFIERALERYKQWKHGTDEERQAVEALVAINGRSLGLDCAREGDDMTIGYSLWGPILERVIRMPMSKADEVVGRVGRLIKDQHFDRVNIEEDPTGGGIIDFLRAEGHRTIFGILPGGKPNRRDKYYNRKTELAFKLRERFVDAENIALDCEDTGGQLSSYKYKFTTRDGHDVYQLEKKDEMKKRLGRSPDDGDAAIYANADAGIAPIEAESALNTGGGDW